jgi:anaerobic magnesium-protoporphyrin IX monomethyl ester cyclase
MMDILFIDPPYISLKQMANDRAYNMGLTSLAAYLREAGIDSGIITGDILMEKRNNLTKILKPAVFQDPFKYADGQRKYAGIVEDRTHPVWGKIADIIRKVKPKTIGIPYITPIKYTVLRVARIAKEIDKDIKVIAGSFHPTLCPDEVMCEPDIDFIVRGEGEVPLLALVKELKKDRPRFQDIPGISYHDKDGAVISNASAPPIPDLDALPFPARDLVMNADYGFYRLHSMLSSRGCPYTCSFCADRRLWGGKVRRRSVKNTISEIKMLQEKYHPSVTEFVDGTFTYDRKYLKEFCDTLIGEGLNINWHCTARYDNLDKEILTLMKKSGCSGMFVGLESGSDRVLDAIDKKFKVADIIRVNQMARDAGILLQVSVLIGLPEETKEDIEATLDLIRKVKADVLDVNSFIPLPGTSIWDAMSDAEKQAIDWHKIGYKSFDNYFSRQISRDDFDHYRARAYRISKSIIRSTVLRQGAKTLIGKGPRIFSK